MLCPGSGEGAALSGETQGFCLGVACANRGHGGVMRGTLGLPLPLAMRASRAPGLPGKGVHLQSGMPLLCIQGLTREGH